MAGRRSKYQEFLHTLKDVVDLEGGGVAKAIGKKYSNVSQYLSGSKKIGSRTLKGAVYHLGEWQVKPHSFRLKLNQPISREFRKVQASTRYMIQTQVFCTSVTLLSCGPRSQAFSIARQIVPSEAGQS